MYSFNVHKWKQFSDKEITCKKDELNFNRQPEFSSSEPLEWIENNGECKAQSLSFTYKHI